MSKTTPRPGEDAAARRAAAELFFEHGQDLFGLFAADGQTLMLNPAWQRLTGWSLKELRRERFSTFIHPDDLPQLREAITTALDEGQAKTTIRIRVRSGEWRWLHGIATRVPGGRIMSVMRDVTEEQSRLHDLEEARRTNLLVSQSAGVGTWSYEPEGERVEWSPDILAITGYAHDEMCTGDQFNAICDPDEVEAVGAAFEVGITSGVAQTFEHKMRTKDGRWTVWRATYHTEPRPGGVYALKGISQDITELAEARDQAMRGEQQVRLLVEEAPFAVAMCDRRLKSLVVSPRLVDTFGLTNRTVIGQRIDQMFPKAGHRILAAQRRALLGEVVINPEEPIGSIDGERRWMRWEVRPWRDATGQIAGVLTYVDDITDLVAARLAAQGAARKLKAALTEAQAANEAKASFLANMSHEIRTPMNGVLGVLHLLRDEALSDSGVKLLEEAVACGRMLSALLNDVLDFSKIEAGHLELAREAVQPDVIAAGVSRLLEAQATAKGLDMIIEGGLGEAWYSADPVRLRQTLFNLVGNAVKFTQRGRVVVRSFAVGEGRLRFEIEDTGVGIDPAAQAGLFQRFTQADASTTRRFGGSGLGLSITRRLAELMGGDVGFTSRPGQGSTFWIEIAADPAAAPLVEGQADGAWLENLRILVVEDNATNRMIATKLLEKLGAQVSSAEDGERGVIAATHGGFDLVLMDIQMPGIDGLEATRRIRALAGPAAHVPIIALTANVLSHQREQYLVAGMNGVVGKPIVPAVLLAEIARIAGDGEARAETSAVA